MDSLALLCNLYADGPATLRRLRLQGVSKIEDLQRRSKEDLTAILALPPATARRFLSEAATLKERVLEREPEAALAAPPAARAAARVVLRDKDELLDEAARRWHELERSAPPAVPSRASAQRLTPAPATALDAQDLDRTTHAALIAAGIETFEELLASDCEALAQASGLGASQVLFAQGLARRRLRDLQQRKLVATPAPGPGSAAAVSSLGAVQRGVEREALSVHTLEPMPPPRQNFSPSERPPREWLSASAERDPERLSAGPFA